MLEQCILRLKCSSNVYEGLNARSEVYLSKEYFCEMYPTCMSSKLCEFICSFVKAEEGKPIQ